MGVCKGSNATASLSRNPSTSSVQTQHTDFQSKLSEEEVLNAEGLKEITKNFARVEGKKEL